MTTGPPVFARADHFDASGVEELAIPVLENDLGFWSHLRLVSVEEASHGRTRVGPGSAVTYTPTPGFSGEDRFSYTVASNSRRDRAEVLVTMQRRTAGEVSRNEKDGLEYAWIPPGKFQMGCTPKVDGTCSADELPPHPVAFARSFWLGTTEVTEEAFLRYRKSELELTAWLVKASPKDPVINVTWYKAAEFCRWSGGRLPTEAEWEYAARGGKSQKYPWGNEEPSSRKGAFNGAAFNPIVPALEDLVWKRPAEVASFQANAFHLFDMAGNVWEWCKDGWYDTYNGAPSDGSARLNKETPVHVVRGGAFGRREITLRAAYRAFASEPGADLGFRCARDIPPPSPQKPSTQQAK